MRILVLGAKGMAGHIIYDRLKSQGHEVIGTSRFEQDDLQVLDVLNLSSWFPFFDTLEVDVVINCIGMLVKAAENCPANAVIVNTLFPKFLETYFRNSKTRVIHISTDCVFDGKRGNYSALETPNETHIYGRSKALGEIKNAKDLTIRTSIIGLELSDKPNASENSGLLHWFLSQPKGSTIQGYSECYWSGISTLELADAIEWYLDRPSCSGLHQVTRAEKISKFELLSIANEVFDRELTIVKDDTKRVDKSLTPSDYGFTVNLAYVYMLRRVRRYSNFIDKS